MPDARPQLRGRPGRKTPPPFRFYRGSPNVPSSGPPATRRRASGTRSDERRARPAAFIRCTRAYRDRPAHSEPARNARRARTRPAPFGVALSTRCSPRLGAYGRGATKALAQLRAPISPVGHEGVHERFEAGAVAAFQQVAQLVHHHVLQALGRIERQTHVDADAARGGLAAAPAAGEAATCASFASIHGRFSRTNLSMSRSRTYAGADTSTNPPPRCTRRLRFLMRLRVSRTTRPSTTSSTGSTGATGREAEARPRAARCRGLTRPPPDRAGAARARTAREARRSARTWPPRPRGTWPTRPPCRTAPPARPRTRAWPEDRARWR